MNDKVAPLLPAIGTVLLGKDRQVKLALSCLFSQGHLLIEDLPGMGKTTLAQALARVLGLDFKRVQFTNDLLPGDILGFNMYDQAQQAFHFQAGAIFSQVLLADEINRATPKTQSALLEAMEEKQVTLDGETRALPSPFFVIATQNPSSQAGTYPLPESQLDRFMMRISLGYPSIESEKQLLKGLDAREQLANLKALFTATELIEVQKAVLDITATDTLIDYIQRLVLTTRVDSSFDYGLSPRGSMALLRAAKAWALLSGRQHVIPEDVQNIFHAVAAHRISSSHYSTDLDENNESEATRYLLKSVDVLAAA